MYPTEAQWLRYYADLAKQCGGEIPIGYPKAIGDVRRVLVPAVAA